MNKSGQLNLTQVSHSNNRIIFARKDYDNINTFYDKINQQVQLLLSNKYALSMFEYKDEVIIEFGSTKPEYMESVPLWLYPDEVEIVADYQAHKDDLAEDANQCDDTETEENNTETKYIIPDWAKKE